MSHGAADASRPALRTLRIRLHTISDPRSAKYRWQLTAANGRVIAMSGVTFDDPAAALSAFKTVSEAAEALNVVVTHPAGRLGWEWLASDEHGAAVASSARTYERRATCQRSYEQFLRALG
jgi:uncharacterized protein YegP (UPF0339 family)